MASSKDGMGSYGQLSQGEEMGASLVAPDPEDVAKPAAAVVGTLLDWLASRLGGFVGFILFAWNVGRYGVLFSCFAKLCFFRFYGRWWLFSLCLSCLSLLWIDSN